MEKTHKTILIPNSTPGVDLIWRNISASVKSRNGKNKIILKNLNGMVKAGQLVAIMGASGAGKTTFLNVLAHQNIKSYQLEGDVLVNGSKVNDITKMSSYLHQEDICFGELTVKEHLTFHAYLRHISDPETRVEEVMQQMNLTNIQDHVIGKLDQTNSAKISGGERKRLSFATEILRQPPLLFCDEPTSGLDSFLATRVVQALKDIAEKGTTG